MTYRREIDGLRAIAVLPVILFHAGFAGFGGGFVGVDVFFVISGYLITSLILSEKAAGKFSLASFYERRVRRILPALLVVLAACIPFALLWLLPLDLALFSRSLAATALFSSNLLFWRENNYFAAEAELSPLLHTWSLAVEEQFYLLFPLAMLLIWPLGKRWIAAIIAIAAIVSLGIAQWATMAKPAASFFLLPTRAWELLMGAMLAPYLAHRPRAPLSNWEKEGLAVTGIGLIVVAVVGFSKETPFPSLYTLVPTIGAALVILYATPATIVGRMLGSRLLVGIGLVSYSAYLWHQPLLAFARHRSFEEPDKSLLGALVIASLLLAYVTWRFVEQPFRNRAVIGRRRVLLAGGLGSIAAIVIGGAGHLSNGTYWRKGDAAALMALEQRIRPNLGLGHACVSGITSVPECSTSSEPEILVWGDSYAMHLVRGILDSNPSAKLMQATMFDCGPFLGLAAMGQRANKLAARRCIEANDRVIEFLRSNTSIKVVVMSSAFAPHVGDRSKVLTSDGAVWKGRDAAYPYMSATLQWLKAMGKVPVIVAPPPVTGHDLGRCMLKAINLGMKESACDFPAGKAEEANAAVIGFLRRLEPHAKVIWPKDGICNDGLCRPSIDGVLIYRDTGHFSYEGSSFIGRRMGFHDLITAPGQPALSRASP